MSPRINFISSIIFALLFATHLSAQQMPAGTQKTIIDGVEYYLYKVQKSEGLYRVSINTQVSQEEIVRLNPEAKDGLKEGQLLKIKVAQTNQPPSPQHSVTENKQQPIIHTVAPQETLYGISKTYGISMDELLKENPGIVNGQIGSGMQLRIPQKGTVPVKNYTKHEVQPGETFYSIARKYKIAAADLRESNMGINENAISTGMILSIPIEAPLTEPTWQKTLNERPYLIHEVGKKETFFGISKKYNIDIEQIKSFNPSVDFGNLQKGDKLKIPTPEWVQAQKDSAEQASLIVPEQAYTPQTNHCNQYQYFTSRPTLKIAILLPFNLAGLNGEVNHSESEDENGGQAFEGRSITGKSKVVIEFYEGFLYALEAYKKRGVNIQLQVYDTTDDLSGIAQVLHKPELATVDLIVGPANTAHIKPVSDFAKSKGIKMVNPFTPINPELNNNPNLFQMTPADSLLWEGMARQIAKDGSGKRVIVIKSSSAAPEFEQKLVKIIEQQTAIVDAGQTSKTEIIEHVYGRSEHGSLSDKLLKDKENIILIPSIDELFVNKVILSLETLAGRTHPLMTLYGLPEWLRFQTVDPEGIHKLNSRIFTYYGIDYQQETTTKFLTEYRELFQTEPYAFTPYFQKPSSNGGYSRFGIWGYDIATWFVEAMVQFGPQFEQCIDQVNPTLIQSNFHFQRVSNWGGFYNNGLFMIQFNNDYSVVRQTVDSK
jgi:LysM repeat protein